MVAGEINGVGLNGPDFGAKCPGACGCLCELPSAASWNEGCGRMRWIGILASLAVAGLVAACGEQPDESESQSAPVRGLITTVVSTTEKSVRRRYPGVLEPTNITTLSFEVTGKLEAFPLQVGQRVAKGDVLAELDSTQFEAEVESKTAAVAEAQALLTQAQDNLTRKAELLRRRAGTRVAVEDAETEVRTAQARLTQSERALDSAREDLTKTSIAAPFDGIINSVDAESFQTVAVGSQITSIYEASTYEVSFSVNFATVSQLVVGTPAKVRLADDPSVSLNAVVSELGERADTVSSFPLVVRLTESHPLIRAGMAVEVGLEFKLPVSAGFLIPITAAVTEKPIPEGAGPNTPTPLEVYVFDPASSTVKRRAVMMAGIRENRLLVIDGLEAGERVASAGVSFLRDGMMVKLIETEE